MAEKRPHEDDGDGDAEGPTLDASALLKRAKQDDASGDEALLPLPPPPPRRSRRSASAREHSDEPAATISDPSNVAAAAPLTVESLQSECDRLREDLRDARSATKAAKEQATLVKALYDDASRATVEAQEELDKVRADNELLRRQLTEGLTTMRALARGRAEQLQEELQHAEAQVRLLTRQNILTNDAVRAKAAKWDAMEAKEEEQRQEMQRRQAKREAERRALQQSLLGDVRGADGHEATPTPTTTRTRMLPQEMFAAVDLEAQKVDVDLQQDEEQESKRQAQSREQQQQRVTIEDLPPYAEDDDDEDEVAALQREAAQFSAGQRPV